MTTFNFSNFVVDKSEILGESPHPKNIVKYLSEKYQKGYDFFQNGQECMLYLDLGYSNLFVIITIVFLC